MARPAALIAPRAVVDFETKSELPIKGKDGVGAWRYAEHHSTEIICLGYRLPGEDVKVWTPDQRFPQELIDFYTNGGTLEAHNAQFERAIWYHVLLKRRHIPMPSRWVDTLASCAYRSLPLALDKVGEVVSLPTKKDKRGSYLLEQLSKPRRPLKADKKRFEVEGLTPDQWPVLWRTKEEFPELYQETYDYCAQDVRTEEALAEMIGDLPDPEYRIWVLDQVINQRGVQIDLDAVHAAQWVVETTVERLAAELQEITGGAVQTGKQVAAMLQWLQEHDCFLDNLQANTVEDYLARWGHLDIPGVRVLQIRQQLSSSSVSKLSKFLATVNDDGRIRGTLQYYGAGTGRWSGRGIQPQNFPRGIEELDMDVLIEAIKNRDLDCLTLLAGDPIEAIASSLRGMIIAAEGKILRVADFSAIEAVVLAWLAGEEWKLEAFASIARKEKYKGYDDIYCATASKILGRFVRKKEDKEGRQVGKTCLGRDTEVLTISGWKRIIDVLSTDLIWDGIEWTRHGGLIYQGEKATVSLDGVRMTPDHRILTTLGWMTAADVSPAKFNLLKSAQGLAHSLLPDTTLGKKAGSRLYTLYATATPLPSTRLQKQTSDTVEARPAPSVPASRPRSGGRTILAKLMSCLTMNFEGCGVLGIKRWSAGVQTRMAVTTRTMVPVEYGFTNHGSTRRRSSGTSSNFLGGMTPGVRLTESTLMGITSLATSAWRLVKRIGGTLARPAMSYGMGSGWLPQHSAEGFVQTYARLPLRDGSEKESLQRIASGISTSHEVNVESVYDLTDCGPRNRFTIRTNTGELIVHNCELAFGYVGGIGAWRNFDRSDTYNDEQVDHFKKTWREEHPEIVKLWWALDEAAVNAIRHKGQTFTYKNLAFRCISDKAGQWLQMILPNGRILWYFNPQIEMIDKWGNGKLSAQVLYEGRDNKRGGAWGICRGYAGIWTENAVQAISRDLMVEAMVRVEASGYPIVLTVHDELVCEVDEDHGSQEEFLDLMINPIPPWAEGCPVGAAGEAMYRYRK